MIRSVAVGICGTDKAFFTGTYPLFKSPIVLGHEAVGVVEGGPSGLRGRLVVTEINFPCWRCYYCRSGLYTHCPHKKTLGIDFDGGLAEYFTAPLEALHPVDGLDPAEATEVEPLAAVLNAVGQVAPAPSARAAVIGSGNLALLTCQVLKLMGVDHVAVVRPDSPKAKHLASLGIATVPLQDAAVYASENTPEGLGFDFVFECSGDPSALNLAIRIARPRGVIHLKSTPGSPFTADMTQAVVKELRIVGTRCGGFAEFGKAVELLKAGKVRPIITSTFEGVENAEEALRRSLERAEVKVVIRL